MAFHRCIWPFKFIRDTDFYRVPNFDGKSEVRILKKPYQTVNLKEYYWAPHSIKKFQFWSTYHRQVYDKVFIFFNLALNSPNKILSYVKPFLLMYQQISVLMDSFYGLGTLLIF